MRVMSKYQTIPEECKLAAAEFNILVMLCRISHYFNSHV